MMPITYPPTEPSGSYVYLFTVDGVPRYVGKGIGTRYLDHERDCTKKRTPWAKFLRKAIRNSRDIAVSIVEKGLSSDEAKALEIELIAQHGRKIFTRGTLFNVMPGGEGFDSETATEILARPEVKRAMREAAKRHLAENKELVEKRRATLAESRKRRTESGEASAFMTARMANPEVRERAVEALHSPESRKKAHAAPVWKSPEFREKMQRVSTEIGARPEVKEKISQKTRENWSLQEYREKRRHSLKKYWEDDSARRKHSARTTETHANAEHKATHVAAMNRPEVKAKLRELANAQWKNEDFRNMRSAASQKQTSDPQWKARHAAVAKETSLQRSAAAKHFDVPYRKVTRELRLRYLEETSNAASTH